MRQSPLIAGWALPNKFPSISRPVIGSDDESMHADAAVQVFSRMSPGPTTTDADGRFRI